ncbi:MAG: nitrophenyl compound nitroreductase subunit ArsF family protein [Patescibacteria group bacterium]|nr:nitrophenyl compound nitroreductase subunit ArsF family protein [Patescibacteria group bacterium]
MNKKIIIGSIIGIGVLVVLAIASSGSPRSSEAVADNQNSQSNQSVSSDQGYSSRILTAEKIEVVHFHATQQCWSCITVGEYALKTIKEKFPEEYKNGVIVYKDVNGELAENRDIVMKYQAGGSSLYTNAITAESEKIEEDVTVWRLVTNEQQFVDYFEAKLKKLLGKS